MSKSNNQLIAGPWVGEFGWELFAWQGYIRALSKKFEKTTVICRENSQYLYRDFADRFIVCEPQGGQSDSFFKNGVDINNLCKVVLSQNKGILEEGTTLFAPRRIGFPPQTHYTEEIEFGQHKILPEYKVYGEEGQRGYDCIFHIRSRELRKEDNWSISNWKKLKSLLGDDKKIACIGTKGSSGCIEGADDLRDRPLEEVCTTIRNSSFAFGPSSGPMHLASLCGCPHVVWSEPENKNRYENTWNPLDTRVLFMGECSWHPEPEYVVEKFNSWRER